MFPGLVVGIDDGQNAERARGAMPPLQLCIGLIALLVPLSMILPGCQQGEVGADNPNTKLAPGNHPPVVRAVTLRPSPLVLTGPIVAQVEAHDVDLNPLSFRYRWIINGQQIPNQDSEQLSPELLKRGDAVRVEVWPHDGMVEGSPFTSELFVVTNSPPVVSNLTFEPESVFPGVPVQARADVSDADSDVIHVSYRWWKNDVLIKEGEERELDTAEFSRGDTLSVEAVPFDGVKRGHTVRLGPIRVGNSPPRIMSAPAKSIVNNRYDYQVEAMDTESDSITFSLETAPLGMSIDERKGAVSWQIPPDRIGIHKVRILAKDSQGAVTFQEFELNLTTAVAARPAGS